MRSTLCFTLSVLALAACGRAEAPSNTSADMANPAQPTPTAARPAGTATPTYLANAGAGDLFEIESSRAILNSTKNADIKSFAQMMIDQHSKSTEKVKAAARAAGLSVPPPQLNAEQKGLLSGIKGASGDAADRAYLEAQRSAHAQALALHQGYAATGDTPSLKKAAGEIAPVVQQHIEMLQKLIPS